MKFGLHNISTLCEALGHPERAFTSIIVGGTNGKGSVTAMVHRALVEAGHRSARYTSPHLERIEERYVIDLQPVDTGELESALQAVREAVEALHTSGRLDAPPTFFECATAAAFELFRRAQVRVAVLEVGLGGRLDATNVVTPVLAAITSIDFDHQAQLGDTLEAIAFEKAGIIKPRVPVVVGELPDPAHEVIRRVCEERGAPLVHAAGCADLDAILEGRSLALPGAHQRRNAEVAACMLRQLGDVGFPVDDDAVRAGLCEVAWPGRLEHVTAGGTSVLLDAAHNPAGARALADYLRTIGWEGAALVFGAMADKDAGGMLEALASVCRTIVCTTADTPRAAAAAVLADAARRTDAAWQVHAIPDPAAALGFALARFPRVVVAGSIFVIGPARGILRAR